MKTDRKAPAEKSPPKVKTVKPNAREGSRSNGKHLLAAYEHIPVGVVEASLDGKYMDVNEEFCRILGYSRRELLRRSIKDCTYEEDYGIDIRLYEQLIAGKIPFYRIEKRYVRKDSGMIWVELTRSLVCDKKGKPLHTVGVVLDISDRKDVERVLRESVERLRLATSAARIFMWEWDLQTGIYTVDDNFEKVLGFPTGLLPKGPGESVQALMPPEDRQAFQEGVEKAIERRADLHSAQFRMASPAGDQIAWLELSGKILYDEEGKALRMLGATQNITENKKGEAALQLARQQAEQSADRTARLQEVTAALSEALTPDEVADVLTSKGAQALGAVSSSMMLQSPDGQTLELMFSTTSEAAVRPYRRFPLSLKVPAADAARSGRPVWMESQQQYLERYPNLAEEIQRWGQQAALAIPMVYKGRSLGVLTLSFDRVLPYTSEDEEYVLTLARQGAQALERARAENALRESEERFRAMVSQATAGIAESDADSHLVFVNPGLCQMLGYSEEELLGKTIWELTYTEDLEENKRLFQRMLEQGESYQFEKRFIRKDGSLLWTTVTVTAIHDLADKPQGGVGVVIDIEERKQAEAALAEYARQQEALYKLADQLHRTETMENVFDAALDAILNALQCDRASILLFDETERMRFVAWRGLSDAYRQATDGHSPWTPDTVDPQPISMEDVRTGDLAESLRAVIQQEGIGALAFIPLVSNGALIGKFMLYFNTPHIFSEREIDLSLTIARQLASGVERKRAEQQLRAKEAELEDVINHTPFMLTRCSRDLRYRFVSRAYAEMLGRAPEDLAGKPIGEIMGEEGFQTILPYIEKVLEGQTVEYDSEISFQDVGKPFLHVVYTPDRNERGEVIGWFASIVDITERKRAEETLRLSEQKFSSIFHSAPFAIALQTLPDSKYVDVNDAFVELLGYSRDELIGKTSPEVGIQVEREKREQATEEFQGQGFIRNVEFRVQTKTGKTIWTSSSAEKVEIAGEDYVLSLAVDITGRKRAEQALRESEQRFREIFETAGVSVWVEDFSEVKAALDELQAHGVEDLRAYFKDHPEFVRSAINRIRVLDVNNETLELFGAPDKQRLLGSLASVFIPETEPVFAEELIAMAEGRETLRTEAQVGALDGRILSVLFTVYFGSSSSDYGRAVVTLTDITERREAEDALRASEERMRLATDAAAIYTWEYDVQNQIFTASENFAEVLGFPEDLVPANTVDVLERFSPAEDEQLVREALARAFERQEDLRDLQYRMVNPETGQVVWVEVNARTIYDWDGKPERMYGVSQNITERKHIEEALRIENERFMEFVESNIVGILIGDASGKVLLANDYYLHLLGVSRQDFDAGLVDWKRFTPPEWIPADEKAIAELRERGYCEPYEKEYIRADGTRVPVYIANAILPGPGDEIAAFVLDITERKRAEETVRRNEQMFSTLVNAAPFGVYFIDSEFRLLSVNKGAEEVFRGIEPLIGRDFAEILRIVWKEPFATEAIERFRHTLRTGESFVSTPISEERANLDLIESYDWQIHRIILPDGTYGVVCYFYDLSEQKKMEAALRASESLYRTIARNIPGGGVYVVDKDFRYLVAEGPVTEAFGLTRDMLEGRRVTEVFPGARGQQMEMRLLKNFAGETVDYETTHNGRVYWTQQAPLFDSIGHAIILTMDITERKRAEEALRQTEERFARFMQHLPGLAWIKDLEGRYIYANAAAERVFNTPWEQLRGRTDEEIFPPEVAAQFRANDLQALADEKGVQVVETLEHDDGVVHYSLVSKFPIPGPDGRIALIGGTAFDITDRRHAEEALRESEERFRAILRQATAGIVRKDPEGKFIYVNEAFCNMLGYTEADLLGKTVWDFMHPDDIAENKRSYERLMGEGIPFKLERRFLRRDGSLIWVDASVSPIMDASGRPQSAVAVEVDITGRKQAEEALHQLNLQLEERVLSRTAKLRATNQALREEIAERQRVEGALRQSEALARANEQKLSTLFELLPVGISFLDPAGEILQTNPALAHILKLSDQQLPDRLHRSLDYIRADGTQMPLAEFASQRALKEGKTVYNVETGVLMEDGEVIWTSVSAAPVDVADVGAVVVTVDITESKRAEQALQESRERLQILSQRLVEVQEEERRAIARELHDRVGQTLAALNINLIIISGQLGGKVDEQVSSRLTDSMKLVAETIALVRDVMSNLRPSVLDDYGLEAAIESHLTQFRSRYEIEAKFEKPAPSIPRLGPSIEMTFLRIAQEALMNIARHAHATQVQLALWQENDAIYMTIQDNGMGIQSWQSANRPGSHGLTIMRERAEAFGGTLKVNSVPGNGTTVEVRIPVEAEHASPDQREKSE